MFKMRRKQKSSLASKKIMKDRKTSAAIADTARVTPFSFWQYCHTPVYDFHKSQPTKVRHNINFLLDFLYGKKLKQIFQGHSRL